METAGLRSWGQKIKQHPVITAIIIVAGVLVVTLIVLGYWFNWPWVGVNGGYNKITTTSTTHGITTATEQPLTKTLWDWLQLLVIPFALAIIAIFFNRSERKNEQRVALDTQQEAALQEYIKAMSELLLEKLLRESAEKDEVRTIARVRTLTVLPRLDANRKKSVLQFLHESGLIGKDKRIINLVFANLSGANLSGANLIRVDLIGADLSGANLSGAKVTEGRLEKAKSLKGATMPDGKIHS